MDKRKIQGQPQGKEEIMYHTYKVTFQNDEGKRKSVKVEASGIIPASQEAVLMSSKKGFCFLWDMVKVEGLTAKEAKI